jgi:membrane protein YqaA with SNARE-associated domain
MRLAASPQAPAWLAGLAFIEGIFFPIPPDTLLMPLVLAQPDRAWRYGFICLCASVLGGCVGYSVGFFLHPVGVWLISLTGGDPAQFQHWYGQWGVFLLALPIPYKITAIASGLFKLNFALFVAASILIRGLRFFLVAGLLRFYGEPVRRFIEHRLALVVSGVALGILGALLVLKLAM